VSDGAVRDRFLDALHTGDRERVVALAGMLAGSRIPLPNAVCAQLGLPPRSAYAAAARKVLAPERAPSSIEPAGS
jgi:hypothetical protein